MRTTVLGFLILLGCFLVTESDLYAQSPGAKPESSGADTSLINTLNNKAYKLSLSDPLGSAVFREKALKLSKASGNIKGIAWAYYLEGVSYTYKNNYLMAIDLESKAIKQAQRISNYELIARAYNVIGLCNLRLSDDYHAMQAFQHALTAIEKSQDKTFFSAIIHNIGSLYIKQKKFEEGFKNFNKAVQLNLKSGNKQWLAQNFLEIGQAYYALNNIKKALEYGERSLQLSVEANYARGETQSLLLLASLKTQTGNFASAKLHLDAGFLKARSSGLSDEILKFYQEYSSWYAGQRNFKKAYDFKNKYALWYDSLNNSRRNKLTLEYQEKFQAEQKEAENKLLKREKILSAEKIGQKNHLLRLFVILFIALLVFVSLIIWGNKKIRLNNRLLRQRNEEIEQQKENVEHLNQIKDKLFSVIAHDLRSPFANMKNMMDLYDEGMISKEEVDFFMKEIRKDIGSNTLLLDNLLIWAKSQLAGFKSHPQAVSVERIVDELCYLNKKKLFNKEITLNNHLNEADTVFADYEMTLAILRNLIGNAIKFTPAKGEISITAVHREGFVEIRVKDTGIGVKPDQLEHLFQDSFFSTPGLNKEKGTGLGLQICRDFAEKNGGKIWFEPEGAGGSSFIFTLPKSLVTIKGAAEHSSNTDELEKKSIREMMSQTRQLQYRYDLYELVAKVTNDTVYDINFVEKETLYNESLYSNFGYNFVRKECDWWLEMLHPDDRPAIEQSMDRALQERHSKWEHEYRFKCHDGTYINVFDRGLILLNEEGQPVRMIGTMQNIQSQKNATHQIQRLSLVAKSVNNLVLISDQDDRVLWVNKAFESHTGYKLEEIAGKAPKEFLSGPETSESMVAGIDQYLYQRQPFSTELVNYTKGGEPYWVQIDCTPYQDPISNQIGYVSIQTVITERKQYEKVILQKNAALREIARISSHDVRRPLSSILGLVKLIENDLDEKELTECLQLLRQSAEQLDSLIYNIHNHIAKIEEDEMPLLAQSVFN